MSKDDLIDSHVSLKQCRQAVEALHSHELKKQEEFEETQLLPGKDQHIWLNVTVKQIAAHHKLKPVKIPIVHPLVDPRTNSVCLITKDPQREYKDLLETHKIKFISRVVGLEKLKGKFKAYEARRMLLKENGLFLADDRIIPLLPKLLGSKWFEAKKQPIPVRLTRKDLKSELERAISSTYMNQNRGTCTSIKIGKMSQTPLHILENLQTALPAVVTAIKGGWDNIKNLAIKTNSSVSLPIWSCTLDDAEGGRWNGLQAKDREEEDKDAEDEEGESEEEGVKVAKAKKVSAKQERKRASSFDEEQETPRKKSKAVDGTSASTKKPKSIELPTSPPKAVSTSKSKRAKAPVTAEDVVSVPESKTPAVPEPTEDIKGKKRKSQKQLPSFASSSSISAAADAPLKKMKSTKPESSTPTKDPSLPRITVPSPGQDKVKKQMKGANTLSPAFGSSVKASISKEEMKQKRGAIPGEKKKRIIFKSKGGRSVKNAVLGKKVAQE